MKCSEPHHARFSVAEKKQRSAAGGGGSSSIRVRVGTLPA
jgi:hypothetical protein